jgi:hypothetical protein
MSPSIGGGSSANRYIFLDLDTRHSDSMGRLCRRSHSTIGIIKLRLRGLKPSKQACSVRGGEARASRFAADGRAGQ